MLGTAVGRWIGRQGHRQEVAVSGPLHGEGTLSVIGVGDIGLLVTKEEKK
jgi:hypothetical protein